MFVYSCSVKRMPIFSICVFVYYYHLWWIKLIIADFQFTFFYHTPVIYNLDNLWPVFGFRRKHSQTSNIGCYFSFIQNFHFQQVVSSRHLHICSWSRPSPLRDYATVMCAGVFILLKLVQCLSRRRRRRRRRTLRDSSGPGCENFLRIRMTPINCRSTV